MIKDKVIVITGGAGLLGKEFIKAITNEGAIAIIGDINEKSANKIIKEITESNPSAVVDFQNIDITSLESITTVIDNITSKYNRIDALVNNAYPRNKNYGNHFFDVEYDDFCENVNIHLGGYFLTSQQFAKYFVEQGYGNIINIASIYGVIAPKFEIYEGTEMTTPVEYAVIKSAIIHFTKYLAKYLKGANIRVNSISPGGILDKQPESFIKAYKNLALNKGMLDRRDIVGSLLFLLSDMSKYINGQNLIIDDGFALY